MTWNQAGLELTGIHLFLPPSQIMTHEKSIYLKLERKCMFYMFDILLASLGQRKKLVITEHPPQARHNSSSYPENYNSEVLLASNDVSGGAGPWHPCLPVLLWCTLSQLSPVTITQHPQEQLVELCALQHTIITAISKVLEMQLYTYSIQ